LLGVAERTAHRDLTDLLVKGVIERVGTTGKGVFYALRKRARTQMAQNWLKRLTKGSAANPP
jgi:hypothetical protein